MRWLKWVTPVCVALMAADAQAQRSSGTPAKLDRPQRSPADVHDMEAAMRAAKD